MNGLDPTRKQLARVALAAFILTFTLSRVIVLLIMSRRMPDLYLHVGGTHVHHLNYGIFLLSAVGGYLLLARPRGKGQRTAALLYGIGLGLTFDEFGMWIHLGGPYWQRASYDAVVVVGAMLTLFAVAPRLSHLTMRAWMTTLALALILSLFAALLVESFGYADQRIGPTLRKFETSGPT
jgi:hypothetical protein